MLGYPPTPPPPQGPGNLVADRLTRLPHWVWVNEEGGWETLPPPPPTPSATPEMVEHPPRSQLLAGSRPFGSQGPARHCIREWLNLRREWGCGRRARVRARGSTRIAGNCAGLCAGE